VLLGGATGLAILATSRERLHLREEHVVQVGGLPVSDSAALPDSGAASLFVQRARQLRPAFLPTPDDWRAIARICRLVDGMPLAIELAAGWADTLALPAIADAIESSLDVLTSDLHDIPARHRSMRAIFDASYQRLEPAERAQFARLAIFRGGGTFEAIHATTAATPAQLRALIGASLLWYDATSGRYLLHDLLRQYAAEYLGATPAEQDTAEQHAAYYCALVERRGAELAGEAQADALAALAAEHDNLRAAWSWAARHGRPDLLARAAAGLGYYYEWRAAYAEAEQAYASAAAELEALPAEQAARFLAVLRAWQANFRRLMGDVAVAERLAIQSLAVLGHAPAGLDTRLERAFILLQLGLIASEGALEDAHRYLEESLALYQALGKRWEASHVLLWLGDLARYEGAFGEARRHFQASLAIRSAYGDRRGVAEVLVWDSHAAADSAQVEEAEALARQSYALHEQLGGAANRAFGLGELGVILMYGGKFAEASRALEQSLALYEDLGNRAMRAYTQGYLAAARLGLGQYEAASVLSQHALAQAREQPGATSGLAFMLHYAGWAALTLGAYHQAEILIRESVALHEQTGSVGQHGWPLAQLSFVHWLLGQRRQAHAELQEVLGVAARQHAFLPLLLALPMAALILAEHGQSERAAELYGLAWRYPLLANARCFADTFGRRLDAAIAALPLDTAAAAQARGRALDLWAAAATLPAELASLRLADS
jgi:predicted ATPase